MRHGTHWLYAVKPVLRTQNAYCWVDGTQLIYRPAIAFKSEASATKEKEKIKEENYRYKIEPLSEKLSEIAEIKD